MGTFTWLDVFTDNGHVLISVWACVLMPKTNDMAQLMHHNAKLVTVFPNGDGLWSSSSAPHIGTAPVRTRECQIHLQIGQERLSKKHKYKLLCFFHREKEKGL